MKPIFILFSLLCISQFTLWSQEKNELNTIEKYKLNKANKLYLSGQTDEAVNIFNGILTKKPTNSTTLYNTAVTLQQKGNIDESRTVYDAAINNSVKPTLKAKANYNVGNSYMKEEKWEDAIKHYKSSLKQNANDEDAKYNLAYANAKLKQQQQQNKDKKEDNKDKKNQDKQDQQDQDQNKQDQNQQKDQDDKEQERKDQQQQQPKRISKEEAEKNMKALREKEKKLHQKSNEKEGNAIKSVNDKDW